VRDDVGDANLVNLDLAAAGLLLVVLGFVAAAGRSSGCVVHRVCGTGARGNMLYSPQTLIKCFQVVRAGIAPQLNLRVPRLRLVQPWL
jgi:hypothetical protein